jgi:hypothetical protein
MGTKRTADQSMKEVRTHFLSFEKDIPTGVIITNVSATHIPPSGNPLSPVTAISSPFVNVTLGPLALLGEHQLDVLATCSDGEILEMLIILKCEF